ncbi:putative Rho guanyl nucleotide exchange factor [Aspergillus saccharolyticus JOP 1030-1]|uniref:Rho guanyl nucleotide exchange factor n=1 Tax=Aspergillus saccharolyticus JOP 1030-1 TaxID=1450539 RepID=A0A318ZAS8_9EURO|nr:rho guanyl nucleotide exchange factor [Aspergillus saccharolyticus JOP 1030-1]PYH44545.1 rho guanyl nucleotide exchange factor [Aspergillus saccharolyticus JOP 1030-1]
MATVTNAPADLPLEQLSLYHASDPYIASVFVFYGPVATANATVSSSRIQAHIVTPAGLQSYPRITISPAAPLYAAVNHLPREKQGDEVSRGLAVSMLKYFAELSDPAKECLQAMARAGKPGAKVPKLFDEMHAADLANRMTKVEHTSELVRDIRGAFPERQVPWVDVDVVLPAGTIQASEPNNDDNVYDGNADFYDGPDLRYGPYTALIQTLGAPMFLPTSRLKRAPSQPTNVSKSKIFSASQKQALRLTMCELVDTEERYVNKLYTLVCQVAEEYRMKAQSRHASSTSPDEAALATLFPPCLNEILQVNMGFLSVIRQVLEETEKDAIADLTEDTELSSSLSQRTSSREEKDTIGAVAFADALLDWFPQFSEPYADYMRAHTGFTQTLNSFMRDKNSSFSKRVYETGEQKLRSLLMEPVQRLPRYSLLIDTMTSSLPLVHPAVRPLLKARDVIKDICSLDDASTANHDQSFRRLKELVDGWPSTILPTGRLITAVDFNELSPPYHLDLTEEPSPGIMLIYKNCLVLLSKAVGSRSTARGLMADLDNAASATPAATNAPMVPELRVVQVYDLHNVRCMQSSCGRILFLAPMSVKSRPNQNTTVDLLALEPVSMYEGRASRIIEEIVKAKIEGRFSESERENGKWTLRSPTGTVANLGVLACVFEEEEDMATKRPSSSRIRVGFNTPRAVCGEALSNSDLEVIVSVSAAGEDQFRVDIDSVVGNASSDLVTAESFVAVLSKRLSNVLLPLHGPQNRTMTESIVHSNFEILRYLASHLMVNFKVPQKFRPSPSKLLSSLLGGHQSKEQNAGSVKMPSSAALLGEFPRMPPPRGNIPRSNTLPSAFPGKEESPVKISVVGAPPSKGQESPFSALEQTFAAFALALQSRSGNIVGRSLRGRDNVDRSSVNELYNILLEDPGKIQAAAEVPVDTLFVAFETFMANAWREHMGPVMDSASLSSLQSQFDSMFPRDFEESFRRFLADMSPQNRRALASMIRLLAELLDASGNDGDRGALTAAFAEVLTVEGDPMQYISLLDRLVDDFDNLFDEYIPGGADLEGTLNCDPTKSVSQTAGSMNSNASSFRKRFGFSLHRDNSKSETESKVSSILRTLSKSKGSGDSEPGTPRGSLLLRSRSIDVDTGLVSLLRPGSRDRPGASTSQEHLRRPGSSQDEASSLSSIRGISTNGVVRIRRRRRSSLSDMRPGTASSDVSIISNGPGQRPMTPSSSLPTQPRAETMTPAGQTRPQISQQGSGSVRSSTSPAKSASPTRLASPSRRSPTRPVTPSRKENIDPKLPQTDRAPRKKTDASVSPPPDIKRRSRATSIPSSRAPGLKERPMPINGADARRLQPTLGSQRTPKLRLQSPQKLRDRLNSEKKAQNMASLGLKDELALIGEELQALRLNPTPFKGDRKLTALDEPFAPSSANAALASRVRSLEARFETFSEEMDGRTAAIEKDLESSLVVSERRAKKLDELYREASAENEALYDRFNAELGKMANDFRTGNVEEALKTQLSSALEEIGRLKKENFRLKREVGGLRAQQAAVALLKASE